MSSVNAGAKLCKEFGLEAVVAVGGGSTIDCSKVIAEATFYDGDAWDLVTKKAPVTKVLPVFSVLTLSATGSEMDCGAVISNLDTNAQDECGPSPMPGPRPPSWIPPIPTPSPSTRQQQARRILCPTSLKFISAPSKPPASWTGWPKLC